MEPHLHNSRLQQRQFLYSSWLTVGPHHRSPISVKLTICLICVGETKTVVSYSTSPYNLLFISTAFGMAAASVGAIVLSKPHEDYKFTNPTYVFKTVRAVSLPSSPLLRQLHGSLRVRVEHGEVGDDNGNGQSDCEDSRDGAHCSDDHTWGRELELLGKISAPLQAIVAAPSFYLNGVSSDCVWLLSFPFNRSYLRLTSRSLQ